MENLLVLDETAHRLSDSFIDRASENIIEDTVKSVELKDKDFHDRKRQLERYLDAAKSQMLFAKSILFAEGISEELLIPSFFKLRWSDLQDHRIEFVNVWGTSFTPFLHLFNSNQPDKKIDKKVVVLTDGDQFPKSKDSEYSFDNLVKDSYLKLDELDSEIQKSPMNSRIPNLISTKKWW